MRYPSLKCYKQIKEEGLLSKRREEVWEALVAAGPCTAGELHRHMERSGNRMSHPHVNARLSELRDLKSAVEMSDLRDCQVTGRTCLVFDVFDGLPVKKEKRKTPWAIIIELEHQVAVLKQRCADLEAENTELKKKGQLTLFQGLR